MRWRILAVALSAVGVSVGVGASAPPAWPNMTCVLTTTVPCLTDAECTPYLATCDVPAGTCVCPSTDMAVGDGGAVTPADFATTTPPPSTGGGTSSSSGPVVGGGMLGAPRSAGCSFVPGSAS